MVKRLLLSTVSLERRMVRLYIGIAIEIRIATTETTTISSTKLKPLPLRVRRPIGCLLLRLAVHIEDALPAPGKALRVVLIAAQSPFRLPGEGVHRDAPQEA